MGGCAGAGVSFAYSEERGNGGFHIEGDLVACCRDLTPRPAAEKGEGLFRDPGEYHQKAACKF